MISKEKSSDQKLEKNLLDTQKDLYSGKLGVELLKTLKEAFPMENCAYVLQWIPEQGEDIFWILVKPSVVCAIEVPRPSNTLESKITIQVMTLDNYLKQALRPQTKRKAALAVKLQSRQIAS